nr:hypothetical protein [Nesterenkonia muleiensis]
MFSPETTLNINELFINKIHNILINDYNYQEFEHKKDTFSPILLEQKIRHHIPLIPKFPDFLGFNYFFGELSKNKKKNYLLSEEGQIGSEDPDIFFKFLIDTILTDSFTETIPTESLGIKEISKKVPRWSYKLINDLEQNIRQYEKGISTEHQIRTRKGNRVVIYTDKQENIDNPAPNTADTSEQPGEIALIRYSEQSDFRRDIIKGSMRVQRRKIVIWEFFQANIHSPLFLDRIENSSFFYFTVSRLIKRILKIFMGKNAKFHISDSKKEELKAKEIQKQSKRREEEKKEKERIEIAETWDSIPFNQIIRGFMLVTQLLFQPAEWSEDFNEWDIEMHVKCTYNGVELSETEFPKNWLTEGIQIKIFFPFRLKPWHRSIIRLSRKDIIKKNKQIKTRNFCFLTVLGMETDLPFGPPRKVPSFFQPIFKELAKKILFFRNLENERKNGIIEILLGLKKKMSTVNPILVFGLREEFSERKKEKDSIINRHMAIGKNFKRQYQKKY